MSDRRMMEEESDGEPTSSLGSTAHASAASAQYTAQAAADPDWVAWSERTRLDAQTSRGDGTDGVSDATGCTAFCSVLSRDKSLLLLYTSVVLNFGILVASVFVFATTSSQLVLAQAADSLLDVGANAVIAYAARVSRKPADLDHLYGHQRAEPIGALVVAVVTVVVAIEVFASAIQALATASYPATDIAIAAVLAAKCGLKLGVIASILALTSFRPSTEVGLYALFIDTRNDVVACAASLGGFALTNAGYGWADGALALLVSIYVSWNGVDLGRENLAYLMGGAPKSEVMEELRRAARSVPGVTAVGRMRAQFLGTDLQVDVRVIVAADALVGEAHDVSVEVQKALEEDPRVGVAFVHVDTEETALREH